MFKREPQTAKTAILRRRQDHVTTHFVMGQKYTLTCGLYLVSLHCLFVCFTWIRERKFRAISLFMTER